MSMFWVAKKQSYWQNTVSSFETSWWYWGPLNDRSPKWPLLSNTPCHFPTCRLLCSDHSSTRTIFYCSLQWSLSWEELYRYYRLRITRIQLQHPCTSLTLIRYFASLLCLHSWASREREKPETFYFMFSLLKMECLPWKWKSMNKLTNTPPIQRCRACPIEGKPNNLQVSIWNQCKILSKTDRLKTF